MKTNIHTESAIKALKLTIITVAIIVGISFCHIASANLINIGQVTFTGDFTLNHLYDFNNPGAQPFGTFSNQSVASVSGLFAPFVHTGDVLGGQPLFSDGSLPLFNLGGFNWTTFSVNIAGADFIGRDVLGFTDLTGNGYQFDPDNTINFHFIAPPYDSSNFHEDITGAITFVFNVLHDDHHVPDGGSTLALMGIGLLGVFYARKTLV